MSHRVIETREQLAALSVGTIVIDADGDTADKTDLEPQPWLAAGYRSAWGDDAIVLPARVLLESWER